MKPKKHICFVTNEYSHPKLPNSGGIGTFVKTIATGLVKKGYRVTIFGYSDIDCDFSHEGIRVVMFESFQNRYSLFFRLFSKICRMLNNASILSFIIGIDRKNLAKKLDNFIKKEGVDLVEFNDYNGDGAYYKSSIPAIIRCHGSYKMQEKYNNFRSNISITFFEKKMFFKIKNIAAVSSHTAKKTQQLFDLEALPKVICNGVDINVFSASDYSYSIEYNIGYIGTISDKKGTDYLCKIFNKINELDDRFVLNIVGKTKQDWDSKFYDILSDSAKKKVNYINYIDYDKISEFLSKQSALIYMTRFETLSMAWIESMAMARPIFVNKIDGSDEMIDDKINGFILDDDLDKSAKIIVETLKNRQKSEKIGILAREKVEREFTNEILVEKTIKYYDEICVK